MKNVDGKFKKYYEKSPVQQKKLVKDYLVESKRKSRRVALPRIDTSLQTKQLNFADLIVLEEEEKEETDKPDNDEISSI